jgi:hypothetical protein
MRGKEGRKGTISVKKGKQMQNGKIKVERARGK